jgi:hypothetical protein
VAIEGRRLGRRTGERVYVSPKENENVRWLVTRFKTVLPGQPQGVLNERLDLYVCHRTWLDILIQMVWHDDHFGLPSIKVLNETEHMD